MLGWCCRASRSPCNRCSRNWIGRGERDRSRWATCSALGEQHLGGSTDAIARSFSSAAPDASTLGIVSHDVGGRDRPNSEPPCLAPRLLRGGPDPCWWPG